MIYFLFGEDHFRLRERERELAMEFVACFPQAERAVFALDEDNTDLLGQIRERLSGGLFASPVILRVHEIALLPEGAIEALEDILEAVTSADDQLVIVSQTGKTRKSSALMKWLAKKAQTETFVPFDEKNTRVFLEWGAKYFKKQYPEVSIDPAALSLLVERVQGQTGVLAQELSKLVAYTSGKSITKADVELFTTEPLESDAFQALDALVSGKRDQAIALFRREERSSVPVQKTLGLCAWQIRRLLEVAELAGQGKRDALAIARELKSAPYPIQKILPKISRFPLDRLKRGMALLADLDLGIRSGRMEPGVALDLFVWKF